MTQCCVISGLWMFPKLVAKMSTHLLIPNYFAHVFPKGGLPRKLRSFVWESVPPHCRRADWKGLSYIFFPSDCMTQSISGKGLKPDIPHFTHGLNHVEHCVPRPIWIKISDVARSYILYSINQSYWTDTEDWTPWAFFMIDTISSQGFLDGVLSSERSFGLLITRFRSVWIHFLLHAFPQITENKAAKHGSAFGLIKLSAFHLHLRPRNRVALWSVLIQASLDCNFESTQKRRSRSHWKPNWQLVWKEILAAYACRCLQGTRDGGKKKDMGRNPGTLLFTRQLRKCSLEVDPHM